MTCPLRKQKSTQERTGVNDDDTIISVSTKPAGAHPSRKGQRIIAARGSSNAASLSSYLTFAVCLIPFHSPKDSFSLVIRRWFGRGPPIRWRGRTPFAGHRVRPANRPSCFQTAQSFPSPVEHRHLTSASNSSSTTPPHPHPAQFQLHQLRPRQQTQATSAYLWAISHSATPIRDPALAPPYTALSLHLTHTHKERWLRSAGWCRAGQRWRAVGLKKPLYLEEVVVSKNKIKANMSIRLLVVKAGFVLPMLPEDRIVD